MAAGLQQLEYSHDGVTLAGRLGAPDGEGPHPAVLVMHDAIGMGSLVQRQAEALARAGYVALAADMYGPQLHSGEPEAYARLFGELQARPELLRGRVLAGYDVLRSHPNVDPRRIVAIGYCLGGQCVLELARSGADVRAVVSFHGLLTTQLPAKRGAVKARVLAITGAMDPYAPPDHLAGFQREMSEAEADWQLTVYGQGWHAFTDPEVGRRADIPGVRYDPVLDRLSWAAANEFLAAALED